MSKQYLTIHTVDAAHPTDIFSLAPTPTSLLSASGSSSLLAHSTSDPSFPVLQKVSSAHKLGAHHVSASASGRRAVSAGFGGEVRVWRCRDGGGGEGEMEGEGTWEEDGVLEKKKAGAEEVWAVAMGAAGRYVATSGSEGGVGVWDLVE
jgi:superkiller protein 8